MYYEDVEFLKDDLDIIEFTNSEFFNCTFLGINFNKIDFSTVSFESCTFRKCHLMSCDLSDVKFIEVIFEESELVDLVFSKINKFIIELEFSNSFFKYCDLGGIDLSKTNFGGSILKECIFFETNLENSNFKKCDLYGTTFENCNLIKADFVGATRFRINPMNNKIKGAKFSNSELSGLLQDFQIKIES